MTDSSKPIGREAVEKFFTFYYDSSDPEKGPPRWGPLIGVAIAGLFIGSAMEFVPAASAAVSGAIAFGIDSILRDKSLADKKKTRLENDAELTRLAAETRKIQSQDVTKAFLRIFDRTLLDRSELRVLEQKYILETERDLFGEESLEKKFGDLVNKSIRLISRGESEDARFRKVLWRGNNTTETFFNPLRMVCLFLAERQLIICDVTIDSIGGNLKEEVNRYSLSQIVSVSFQAERARLNLTKDQIAQTARDLGYDETRIKEISDDIERDPENSAKEWSREESTSMLRLSRTDGGILQVPIRSELLFGKHRMALDQDEVLTSDELIIDRMVNELNRLVDTPSEHA